MKKHLFSIFVCAILALMIALPTLAQNEEQLVLRLNRDFGYGGIGNDIQGFFSIEVREPPANLVRVEFTIDGELLGEDNEARFEFRFSTDSYPLGDHVLAATGYTADGQTLGSNVFNVEFVSAEAGWQAVLKIIGPVFGIIFVILVLSFLTSYLSGRKLAHLPPGTPRNYGIKGGTICPRCARPFAFQFLALNMGPFHKLDRCPHCGRWGFLRRRSLEELRLAEAAELEGAQGFEHETSEEEKLRKELDDSRYQNT